MGRVSKSAGPFLICALTASASGIPGLSIDPVRFADGGRIGFRRAAGSDLASRVNPSATALLPLFFERQPGGSFLARAPQAGLLFETDAIQLVFGSARRNVAVGFPGARKGVAPLGENRRESISNYFRAGVAPIQRLEHYGAVRYPALWRGIDLLYYGREQELEYDFQVAPNADPGVIRLSIHRASVSLDMAGDLWISNAAGKIRQHRPVIYQEVEGRRVSIDGGFRIFGKDRVGFWLGKYDSSRPLTIDPVLDFSTLLGGQGVEVATGIAVDSSNNIYVTGYTEGADFLRTSAGAHVFGANRTQDAFLIKIDGRTKQAIYANFYGGSNFDIPISVAVDSTGAATIVGLTFSADLPAVSAYLARPALIAEGLDYGFAARFSPNGASLVFSTYVAPAEAYGVAVTASGSTYIVGGTFCFGPAYPNTAAYREFVPTADAFQPACNSGGSAAYVGYIIRLGTSGQKEYASYFAPSSAGGRANGLSDVAVDSQGNFYVSGSSPGTQTVPRYQGSGADIECTVSKFNRNGTLLWTTFVGGERDEEGLRIAIDSSGNSYVTGYTTSQSLSVTAGAFQTRNGTTQQIPNVEHSILGDAQNRPLWEAFVAKLSTAGQVVYTTYLGGNGDDYAWGIAADTAGRAYVTGYTNSRNFPVTPGAYQTTFGGGPTDAYIATVSSDGRTLEQATFLGGTGSEEGYQVALDSEGNLYFAGSTQSANMPLTPDALQTALRGTDAAIVKLNIQDCTVTVNGVSRTAPSGSGNSSFSVTTSSPGCSWTLSSQAPWIQINPSRGTGSTTVQLSVSDNTSTEPRLGVFAINGRRTYLYQDGRAACRLIVAPTEVDLSSNSERRPISIQTTDSSCKWTVQSDQPWLKVLSDTSGSGTASVVIGTEPNSGGTPRTGNLTIGERRIPVSQSAGGCTLTTSSESGAISPAGGLGGIRVLASSDLCSWRAQSQASWITILVGDSGYGTGRVRFAVAANNTGQIRIGTVLVADLPFTVRQEEQFTNVRDQSLASGASASQAAAPAGRSAGSPAALRPRAAGPGPALIGNCGSKPPATPIQLDANGTKVTLPISRSQSGCQLTAIAVGADWLTVNVLNASAINPSIEVSARANPNSQPRKIEVHANSGDTGQSIWKLALTQAGAAKAPLALEPKKQLQAEPGQAVVQVNTVDGSPCDWTIENPPAWVLSATTSGACGSSLVFNYDRNTGQSARLGAIRFNTGDEVQLEQSPASGPVCTFSFQEKTPLDIVNAGGQVRFNVSAPQGCTWSIGTNKEEWISFPNGRSGTGSQSVAVNVAPNDTTSIRMAAVTVDNATAYVREAAALVLPKACTYTLSPQSANFGRDGGTGSIQVTTSADCLWQTTSPPADTWVRVTSGSGSGSGLVAYSVDPNPQGGAARSTTLSVQGVSFRLTQDAGPPGSTPTLNVSAASLAFAAVVSGAAPASQSLSISSGSTASYSWTVQAVTTAGGSWLQVSRTSGTGDATIQVTANPNFLAAGIYQGSITVAAAALAGSPKTVNVSLTIVAGGPLLSVSSNALTFDTSPGADPPVQTVTITNAGTGTLSWQASASSTNNWLRVNPISATSLQISAVTAGLSAGTYTGTVTITAPSAVNSPATIRVTLNLAAPGGAVIRGVFNAASYGAGGVSPGENVVLFGSGIGPESLAVARLVNNAFEKSIGTTRVLFDGVPSAMIYASSGQTSVMVPYAVAGRTTTSIVVEVNGVRSAPADVRVVPTFPGIYTLNQSGTGLGAILNQNFSVNGAGNPATRGSVIQVYMTGEGVTQPAGTDGGISGSTLLRPAASVTATIGGFEATVLYAGSSPGIINGVMQVNLVIPANAPSGNVPILITVGSATTQADVTVRIQ